MLNDLKERFKDCSLCGKCDHNNKIFGSGNKNAQIMIVSESPGKDEIEAQEPLAGLPGEMLYKALAAIGLKKEDLYFTNTILCKTNEKDRAPSWDETQNCSKRLEEEINIVLPNVIIMVGSTSLKRFFGKSYTISENHGRWLMNFQPPYSRYFSIFHPAWVLNAVSENELKTKKKILWEDIKIFRRELDIANFTLRRESV